MKKTVLILAVFLLSSCAYLRSASQTSIPKRRGKEITAESYKFIFLLLNFDNSFADEAREKLIKKCPNGNIKGILTKSEDIVYFPLIAHAKQVTVKGFCDEK